VRILTLGHFLIMNEDVGEYYRAADQKYGDHTVLERRHEMIYRVI
jgi:hypothetical protein